MKKKIFALICLSLSLLTAINLLRVSSEKIIANSVSVVNNRDITIVLDCGHGGEDGGAVSENGLVEKDVNLEIGLILEKLFLQGGFEVIMIRSDDSAVYDAELAEASLKEKKVSDIHNRSDICNSSPDNVYISIHQNMFEDSKYCGTQVFYSANDPQSPVLAESIRLAVKGLLQNDNERQCKEATSSIYVLDKAQVPAVLVECGFLSNSNEESLLKTDKYRKQIAFAIYSGFLEYYYQCLC